MRLTFGLGICLSIACAPRTGPSRAEVRAACDVGEDLWVTAATPVDLSADCAAALAEGVALESEALEPGEAGWPVLLGALALASADFGSVGELTNTPGSRGWGKRELADFAEEERLDAEDPAGELLWRYQLRHVRRVVLDDDLPTGGRYDLGSVRLPAEPDLHAAPPTWLASVFLHEAGHARGPAHGACADGGSGCDPDLDGVYGLQALILTQERTRIDPWEDDADTACEEVRAALVTVCGRVDDGGPLCRSHLDDGCGVGGL